MRWLPAAASYLFNSAKAGWLIPNVALSTKAMAPFFALMELSSLWLPFLDVQLISDFLKAHCGTILVILGLWIWDPRDLLLLWKVVMCFILCLLYWINLGWAGEAKFQIEEKIKETAAVIRAYNVPPRPERWLEMIRDRECENVDKILRTRWAIDGFEENLEATMDSITSTNRLSRQTPIALKQGSSRLLEFQTCRKAASHL